MAKFNKNSISKRVEETELERIRESGEKMGVISVRLPMNMIETYRALLAKTGSNPGTKTRELIYEYVNKQLSQ